MPGRAAGRAAGRPLPEARQGRAGAASGVAASEQARQAGLPAQPQGGPCRKPVRAGRAPRAGWRRVSTVDLGAVGERLEVLFGELRSHPDREARLRAEEAVRLVTELYGAGLANVLELVVEAGDAALLDRIVSDRLVAGLLVLHRLHPLDLTTRIGRALDEVRPYLASHGGDVEVLDVDGAAGVVVIRLLGSCDGCPSSSVTLKLAVEDAISAAAPEVAHVVVDGWVAPEPPPAPVALRTKPVAAR